MTPAPPGTGIPAPTVIAHLSDLHIGAHDPATVDSLVADVVATAPALTVITGDLTMRARPVEFAEVSLLLGRLPSPRLVVLGNHDVPLALTTRLRKPYAGYAARIQPELDPFLELPGVRALGLNSMPRWRWKAGRVSRRQLDLVAGRLGAGPSRDVRLLAVHHPLSKPTPAGVAGRGRLLQALATAGVDLVLAGHTHIPAVRRLPVRTAAGHVHHVLEVTAGTATSNRLRGVPRSWTLLRVGHDAVDVHQRRQTPAGWRDGPSTRAPREDRVIPAE